MCLSLIFCKTYLHNVCVISFERYRLILLLLLVTMKCMKLHVEYCQSYCDRLILLVTALRYTEWLVIYLLSIENDCVLEF